jgi:hypothetical protein
MPKPLGVLNMEAVSIADSITPDKFVSFGTQL